MVHGNDKEAVDAVIMFTTDAVDLLKRKKMKRDYLFRYLAQNNVPISPTADKNQLSQAILELWGSHIIPQVKREFNMPVEELAPYHHQQQQQQLPQQQQPQQQQQQQQQLIAVATPQPENDEQKLPLAFANWFYELLNAQHPNSGSPDAEDFGSQHFYGDCKLCLVCLTTEVSRMEYAGSDLASRRLLALVREEQLLFQPNLCPEGIQGRSDPHGLRYIIVCGSIHQRDTAIGIFEQEFGLVQEPITNSWKIKYTNLKIRTQPSLEQIPTLQHTRNILGIEA